MSAPSEEADGRAGRAGLVATLLPQRAPLLFVDTIVTWTNVPRPALTATFTVPPDHPVLAGHFPGRPLWPGVHVIEGLAQACLCLGALANRGDAPGHALLGAVDVKLVAPVLPGDVLSYEVALTHGMDAIRRFAVDASVAGRPVARGALTVAIGRAA